MYRTTAASLARLGILRQAAGPSRRPPLAEIVLVGAHGGAGVSTLAALLSPAWDMGAVQGRRPGGPLRPGGRPVVLAAGNTVAAAGRAVAATTAITGHGTHVAVLVVVSDGLPGRGQIPVPGPGRPSRRRSPHAIRPGPARRRQPAAGGPAAQGTQGTG